MGKSCILPFLKKSNLSITKNYRGVTLTGIAAKVYNDLFLNHIQPEIKEEIRMAFGEIAPNLTDSDNLSNHPRSMNKESQGNTTVCKFLQSIQFHTQERWNKYYLHMVSPKKLLQL